MFSFGRGNAGLLELVGGGEAIIAEGRGAVVEAVVEDESLDGEPIGVWGFVGEARGVVAFVGVVGRRVEIEGEGEAGDSGRRKGEVRGEPKERGEGL